jgi:hypothetical protein
VRAFYIRFDSIRLDLFTTQLRAGAVRCATALRWPRTGGLDAITAKRAVVLEDRVKEVRGPAGLHPLSGMRRSKIGTTFC